MFLVLTRSKEVLLSPCCKGCKWLTVVYKLLAVRDGEVVVGEEIPGKRREGVTSECGKGGWVETGVTKDELKPKERIVEKGREQCGQL